MSLVLLESGDTLHCFTDAQDVIQAREPGEVAGALAAMTDALAHGCHLAGYFSYELGAALELRLAGQGWGARPVPLLWFGIFGAPQNTVPELPPNVQGPRAYAGPLAPEWDEANYAARFARVKDYIAAGDVYQVNLSLRADFAFLGEARALYRALVEKSGAAHCAFIDDGERQILSLSPELFFELSPQGALTARPMKGTSARGGDDAVERAALAASPKDRAENLMIVDLTRNDLGRIAETGSVGVRDLFAVETYPTLHAMVSTVTARLKPDASVENIVRALFPCGSITGAPKIRAMEIIRELEASPRGIYCGAIGMFAPADAGGGISARFNVAIRTLTVAGGRGSLGIGGAVVQDSGAASEYAECLLKARFFDAARRPLLLIETLRFEKGFVRIESHLTRMRASARAFAIAFDEATARKALDDAVAGMDGVLRVRLTLDESGHFACTSAPLPPAHEPWTYAISPRRISSADLLLRHKTDWREWYEEESMSNKADEMLFLNERGELAEGARTNIFIRRGGKLLTPSLESGVLDGRLRAELVAQGKAAEAVLTTADLENAEIFLGNSLRGLICAVPHRS